jgi:hypothetical protein
MKPEEIKNNILNNKLNLKNKNICLIVVKKMEKLLSTTHNITEIDLSQNLIGDTGLKCLQNFLSKKMIKVINLDMANLSNLSIKTIKKIVETNQSLEKISLQLNHFSDDGIIELLDIYKKSKNLRSMAIFGNPFESELLLETFYNVYEKKTQCFISCEKILKVDGGYIDLKNQNEFQISKDVLGRYSQLI